MSEVVHTTYSSSQGDNTFIASIEEEIEKLRARRNGTTTDSEEDDESKFALLDSVCPPAEQDVFEVLVKTDIEEQEEKDFKDIDYQINDLYNSINFKSKKLKRQFLREAKPVTEINHDLEVDFSRCEDEDDL